MAVKINKARRQTPSLIGRWTESLSLGKDSLGGVTVPSELLSHNCSLSRSWELQSLHPKPLCWKNPLSLTAGACVGGSVPGLPLGAKGSSLPPQSLLSCLCD